MRHLMRLATMILQALHLPAKPLYFLLKGVRIAAHPTIWRGRQRRARELVAASPWRAFIDPQRGYARFEPDNFAGTERLIATCQAIVRGRDEGLATNSAFAKPFLRNILSPDDLEVHSELLDFALEQGMIEAVAGYLDTLPLLRSIGLYYSPVNTTTVRSQCFHVDAEDFRQIKCFVNVFDVEDGAGPLTLLPADLSARVRRRLGHGWRDRRLSDDEVLTPPHFDDLVTLVGPAGVGCFVDTSNCLHFGSRARRVPRVVFMAQYTSYPHVGFDWETPDLEGRPLFGAAVGRFADDPLRRAVLSAGA